jgi:hypothetical protein
MARIEVTVVADRENDQNSIKLAWVGNAGWEPLSPSAAKFAPLFNRLISFERPTTSPDLIEYIVNQVNELKVGQVTLVERDKNLKKPPPKVVY